MGSKSTTAKIRWFGELLLLRISKDLGSRPAVPCEGMNFTSA